jgi:hypothetical protein
VINRPHGLTDLRRTYATTVDAAGTATVEISPATSYSWNVTQLSVELAAAPAGAACRALVNGVFLTALIPSGDVAVEPPPILLQVGDVLAVEWTGCTPGAGGTVLVIYDELVNR